MQYKLLGNSDLNVSRIAFGCMSLGENHLENTALLHRACDFGINFFDTANIYQNGFNEETVGQALKDRRDKVFIATKAGNQPRKDGSGWDWNPRKSFIKKCLHESLKRLQTDYIDLFQLHGGTIDDPTEETIEAFEELKAEGHIRWYGISSIRPNVIRRWVEKSNMVSTMMQFSLADRRPEESCLDLLKENKVGVIVRGALAKGLLAGKPAKSYLKHSEEGIRIVQNLLSNLEHENRKSGDIALQFVLAHPAVTTIAAGIRTKEQLEQNARIFDIPPLTDAELRKLREEVPQFQYDAHR